MPVIQRSIIRQTVVGVYCNGWEKIKLDEEAISEILVTDTDSESGSAASDFENYSIYCCLCSCGQRKHTVYKCATCDMSLCMVPCFEEYHTKVNL